MLPEKKGLKSGKKSLTGVVSCCVMFTVIAGGSDYGVFASKTNADLFLGNFNINSDDS